MFNRLPARFCALLAIFALLSTTGGTFASSNGVSDDEIRQSMIVKSIQAYPGSCPCPYNHARNGSRCGKRSAWSRPGGYSPLCFASDISDKMVKDYRVRHGLVRPKKQ